MHLQVITPDKTLFNSEIEELIVDTPKGQLTILPHHINLITSVIPSELIVKQKGKEHSIAVAGGFLEIFNNTVKLLADYAIETEEINMAKVLEAQKRAEEAMHKAKEQGSERDFARAESDLRRSLLQIDIANRKRRKL